MCWNATGKSNHIKVFTTRCLSNNQLTFDTLDRARDLILDFISRMNGLEDTLKRNHFKSYGIESFTLETNSRTLILGYS